MFVIVLFEEKFEDLFSNLDEGFHSSIPCTSWIIRIILNGEPFRRKGGFENIPN